MYQSKCLSVIEKESMKVLTETHLRWRNHPIPSIGIGIVDLYNDLRVWILVGHVHNHISKLFKIDAKIDVPHSWKVPLSFGNSKRLTLRVETFKLQDLNEGEVNIPVAGLTGFMHVLGWELSIYASLFSVLIAM